MLQNLRPMEIILIVGIILLLFGAKKLPQLARSVGESMKIFKKEVHEVVELRGDAETPPTAPPAPSASAAAMPVAAPVPAEPRPEQAGTPAA